MTDFGTDVLTGGGNASITIRNRSLAFFAKTLTALCADGGKSWILVPILKRIMRILVCFCLAMLSGYTASAQSADLLTGNLQYGIPLGEVSANDISIPVRISQHGNALTVAEGEGDCGMGWSLSAGGAVTRLVRGLPDELDIGNRKGWTKMSSKHARIQTFSPGGDDTLDVCSDEANDFLTLDSLAYTYDTEPDLFFFHAPGISGQFILSSNGTPQLLNLQDITISTFRSDSFSIKTNRGFVYSFSTVESTSRSVGGTLCDFTDFRYNNDWGIDFTSRWLLTRIQSTATGTTADFTYTSLPEASQFSFKEDSLYYLRDKFEPKRLATIELKTFRAEFSWANNLVRQVRIQDTVTTNGKTFEFYYKTFKDTLGVRFPAVKAFLHKLREVGPNCSPYASYEFSYAGVNWSRQALAKPWKRNIKQDWFGYLTGRHGSLNLPTVHFFDGETDDARRVRMVNGGGGTHSATLTGYNRTVNPDSAMFGALTKVVTPSGGIVEISWESNTYYDSALQRNALGGGVRVKKISMNGSDVAYGKSTETFNSYRAVTRSYEYKESIDTISSGKLLAPLKFGYYTVAGRHSSSINRGDPSDIMYARVIETVDTLGYTIYEFSIPGVFPQTQKYEWKATKSRIARKSGTDCGCENYRNGYFAYPFAPSTNFGHRRGFLKAVYQYSQDSTLVRKREMTALQLPASPPAPVKAIRFERTGGNRFYYGIYEILTGRAQVVASEKVTEYPESGSTPMVTTTRYTYNSDHMLSQITDTLVDGSVRVRNMKYAKEFSLTSPTQPEAVAIKNLKDANRHGELIEQSTYVTVAGGTTVLTDANLILFKTFSNGRTLPGSVLTMPRGAALTAAYANTDILYTDADYKTVRTFNDYDSEGRVLWESDEKQNKVAHSYATAYGYPTATFANVPSGYAVHESFETPTTAGLTVSVGSPTLVAGWTGEKAMPLTTSLTLTSGTLTRGSTTHYRLSCWAKAASATSVYFKAQDGSLVDIDHLAISDANEWQYYEKTVSASGVASSFALIVTVGGNVTVDDIIFAPAEARVALQTAKPMVGATSASDDRGNSVSFAHDGQGRKVGTFDRQRNLIQKIEYGNQKSISEQLHSGFTSDATHYKVGTEITFTAPAYCNSGSPPSYKWKVDTVTQSTSSTLVKTFTIPGQHNVSLTISKSGMEPQTFDQDICFDLAATPEITAEDNQSNEYESSFTANCNTPTLYFTANNIPMEVGGCTTTITWRVINYIWVTDHYEVNVVSSTSPGTDPTFYWAANSAVTVQAMVDIQCTAGSELTCLGGTSYFILGFDINWETVDCQ